MTAARLLLPILLICGRPAGAQAQGVDPPKPPALAMTPPVVCAKVEGLDRYTPLPDATLTNLDKLKVYFRPLHYKVEADPKAAEPLHAHFTLDGRLRRKGEKKVLAKEDKLLDYEARFAAIDYRIYLVAVAGLEDFPPGEYEFDLTLHDAIDGRAAATQTVAFRIKPPPPGAAVAPPDPPEAPAKSKSDAKTKKPASTKKAGAGRDPSPTR